MRRVVQRSVENLVAKQILNGSAQPGQTITISETDIHPEN
jgi:ATP-dependent Clp protease ATP-binding subunit ClpA